MSNLLYRIYLNTSSARDNHDGILNTIRYPTDNRHCIIEKLDKYGKEVRADQVDC